MRKHLNNYKHTRLARFMEFCL